MQKSTTTQQKSKGDLRVLQPHWTPKQPLRLAHIALGDLLNKAVIAPVIELRWLDTRIGDHAGNLLIHPWPVFCAVIA